MIPVPPAVLANEDDEDSTRADASAEATGTTVEAGVSISANDNSAMAASWAASSHSKDKDIDKDKSSETRSSGEGKRTRTDADSYSNGVGSISSSVAVAIGNIISVFSQSSATGKYVGGLGATEIQGSQRAETMVDVSVLPTENGLYSVIITASGDATGDAQGTAWTMAYGGDIPFNLIINPSPPPIQIVQPVVEERAFFGFTFGKCDVQRYKHFWLQLRNDNSADDNRALYWMQIIAGANTNYPGGEQAMQVFEEKYNITSATAPDWLDGNGDKNGKWCRMPEK